MRFSIIIPNYNSEKWIIRLLDSIKNQTYGSYEVIIIDDCSADRSFDMIREYIFDNNLYHNFFPCVSREKKYNGGARNMGLKMARGDYILFADCDDWFYSDKALEEINQVIEQHDYPDLVRLPYRLYTNKIGRTNPLNEKNLEELSHTIYVAPWTKCIKRQLFVPFPENTLLEDVVQHIAQLDKTETMEHCPVPIMVWNRANEDAISSSTKTYTRESKRYTSIYRNLADLLDLRVQKPYCEEERQRRIAFYLDIVHNAKEDTIINVKE